MAISIQKNMEISGAKYTIIRELSFCSCNEATKYMDKYKFFEVRGENFFSKHIAAKYKDFWAVGENFYDASDKLESKMFAVNRANFLSLIDKVNVRIK